MKVAGIVIACIAGLLLLLNLMGLAMAALVGEDASLFIPSLIAEAVLLALGIVLIVVANRRKARKAAHANDLPPLR